MAAQLAAVAVVVVSLVVPGVGVLVVHRLVCVLIEWLLFASGRPGGSGAGAAPDGMGVRARADPGLRSRAMADGPASFPEPERVDLDPVLPTRP